MASIGFGAKLSYDPGTGTFTQLTEVTMVSIPTPDVNMVDVSHLNMSDRNKQFVPGLQDPGMVEFTLRWTKAKYATLFNLVGVAAATTAVRWKIESPDDDGPGPDTTQTFTFAGTLTKLETQFEVETPVDIKGSVKVSGAVTVG